MSVKLIDNSSSVKDQLGKNVQTALMAIGTEAVALIRAQMESGYGKPIRDTGNLMRDVQFAVENSEPNSVDVGNTLEYAKYVHDGHNGHSIRLKDGSWITLPGGYTPGRPYLKDALLNGTSRLENVTGKKIKIGF